MHAREERERERTPVSNTIETAKSQHFTVKLKPLVNTILVSKHMHYTQSIFNTQVIVYKLSLDMMGYFV